MCNLTKAQQTGNATDTNTKIYIELLTSAKRQIGSSTLTNQLTLTHPR